MEKGFPGPAVGWHPGISFLVFVPSAHHLQTSRKTWHKNGFPGPALPLGCECAVLEGSRLSEFNCDLPGVLGPRENPQCVCQDHSKRQLGWLTQKPSPWGPCLPGPLGIALLLPEGWAITCLCCGGARGPAGTTGLLVLPCMNRVTTIGPSSRASVSPSAGQVWGP